MTNALPCPLCHSTNLSDSSWYLEDGEVDAVECNDCYCGAPVTAWQNRLMIPEHDSGETLARCEAPGLFEGFMNREIYCCACEADVVARLTDGGEIYPNRPDLGELPFWRCDACHTEHTEQ